MSLLNILSSIFMFFLMVAWIWVMVLVISDLFRSDDLSGWGKALWALGIIIIPWLGVLAYLLLRGEGMSQRSIKAASDMEDMRRSYIREVAGPSTADELAKLAELKDKGVISEEEFLAQKAKILG
jgi:hypothetical protein